MASRVTIKYGYDAPHILFTYGSTFNNLVLTPHKIFTLDFQTGISQPFINMVVKNIRETFNPKTEKVYFNKIHVSKRQQALTSEETKSLAETETTLNALQTQREHVHDRILVVGSEDFYKQREMKIKNMNGVIEHTSHMNGVFVMINQPPKQSGNYRMMYMHKLETGVLSKKVKVLVNSSEYLPDHHKARIVAAEVIEVYKSILEKKE